jgi:NADPH:quinone reductase-like Zn-dependent oxidoreductase
LLATIGAHHVRSGLVAGTDASTHAALAGLLRVTAWEDTDRRCVSTDGDSHSRWTISGDAADVHGCSVRHGLVLSRRLVRSDVGAASGDVQLAPRVRGSLDALMPMAVSLPSLGGDGCIHLSVRAVGINFRDVLNVLGMYPGDPGAPGSDCAGVNRRTGEALFGLASGALGTCVVAPAAMLAPMPASLTFEEASTTPTAFVTCAVGLVQGAGLRSCTAVLIHASSGGVGQAACQMVTAVGALAMGSAGSERKRRAARVLGVAHVSTSRGVQFAEHAMVCTRGAGVGVVLNSLTSPGFVAASLAQLGAGGRLLEIGKRDVWGLRRVGQEDRTSVV